MQSPEQIKKGLILVFWQAVELFGVQHCSQVTTCTANQVIKRRVLDSAHTCIFTMFLHTFNLKVKKERLSVSVHFKWPSKQKHFSQANSSRAKRQRLFTQEAQKDSFSTFTLIHLQTQAGKHSLSSTLFLATAIFYRENSKSCIS